MFHISVNSEDLNQSVSSGDLDTLFSTLVSLGSIHGMLISQDSEQTEQMAYDNCRLQRLSLCRLELS